MSTHAYYSSGENLDGEYVLPEYAHAAKPTEIVYPPEFDYKYYYQKRDSFDRSCPDYWEWELFRKYCKAVYKLYVSAINAFCEKFNVEKTAFNVPNCIVEETQIKDIEFARNELREAEQKLYMQFNKSNRSIKAKINKFAPLKKLRQYAGEALTLYYVLTEELYLKSAIKFKNYYLNYNFDADLDNLLCFRNCVILERQTRLYIKPDLLTDKHHLHNADIYDGVNFAENYNNLCQITNAFNTDFYSKKLIDIEPKIEELKNNKNYYNIITLYENFDYINLLIYHVNHISKYNKNKNFVTFACFETAEGINGNVFELAQGYLKFIVGIQAQAEALCPTFKKDVDKLIEKLTNCLQDANEVYEKSING